MLFQVESIEVKRRPKWHAIVVCISALLLGLLVAVTLFVVGNNYTKKSKVSVAVAKNIGERVTKNSKSEETKAAATAAVAKSDSGTSGAGEQTQNADENSGTQQTAGVSNGQTGQSDEDKKNFVKAVNNIYDAKEGKRVFLTFDDGPSQSVTPHILDTLKKYNIKATFFVLGSMVKTNPDVLKREYAEGHYIANHSYSHDYGKIYANAKNALKEYEKTEKAIQEALGNPNYSSNLFRFPGGSVGGPYDSIKKKAKKTFNQNNVAYLDWNALTNDADGANTKKAILSNLKETVGDQDNVVLLMHDAPDKELTYKTLEDVIKYLQGKGYVFKSMYDLM